MTTALMPSLAPASRWIVPVLLSTYQGSTIAHLDDELPRHGRYERCLSRPITTRLYGLGPPLPSQHRFSDLAVQCLYRSHLPVDQGRHEGAVGVDHCTLAYLASRHRDRQAIQHNIQDV